MFTIILTTEQSETEYQTNLTQNAMNLITSLTALMSEGAVPFKITISKGMEV